MCGIVGFIGENQPSGREAVLAGMMKSIQHRGPDDQGTYFDPCISFGHQRLSIIDIDNGHQPFISQDKNFVIVFNGEIYNYLELRQGLLAKGYKFATFSDTEVLLNMYIDRGREMLNVINGMFAFAIYDRRAQKVFMARDHFGIKPLYFYSGEGILVFGSEIKALLKFPSIQASVNQHALQEYLTFQFVLHDQTLFQDILKIEPGEYLEIGLDGRITEKRKYWEPVYQINTTKSNEEFLDEILVTLENSLSIQVRSDVPVGAYLSGGIDSSSVAILASKNYFSKFKTFSGGFRDEGPFDETSFARLVSTSIEADHHEIFPTEDDFIDTFDSLIYHMDEPAAGPGLFPQYMVSKLAAEHVKVVLGGQGGDEIFGGYTRYLVAYLEQCLKGSIFDTQEEGQHIVTLASIVPNLTLLKQYVPMIQSQFSEGLFETMDKRYYQLINRSPSLDRIYTDELVNSRNEERIFERFTTIFNSVNSTSYFNKMTFFDLRTLLPALLHIEDRVSMAVSLESRVPFLDKRLVELVNTIPPTMKFAGGKPKHMLIESVKNLLPKEIVERKDKMGFPVPINAWMQKGNVSTFLKDTFHSKKTRERGLVDVDRLTNQIHRTGKFSRDIWGALSLEKWFQTFIDK